MSSPPQAEANITVDADSQPPTGAPVSQTVLVDRLLVEEWIVLSTQRVWWGAGAKVSREGRERALQAVTRVREVAAAAGIDLHHVQIDDDDERLVDLSCEEDGETGLAWGLATAEKEIRKRIASEATRVPTKSTRRSR